MNRFFLPSEAFQGNQIIFPADRSHQIARVLRLQPGEKVAVIDLIGNEYLVALVLVDAKQCLGEILSSRVPLVEAKTEIHLLIALTQREKFEMILQKCTEIGVFSFTPVLTERSLVQGKNDPDKKNDRWNRIVMEAAEQSHRTHKPEIFAPIAFQQCLDQQADQKLIAFESEQLKTIENVFTGSNAKKIALLIGPEGGFSDHEVQMAKDSGWAAITLGPRILRMETAAIVASALILNYFGDMGS